MNYEEAESAALDQLIAAAHYEQTGQRLLPHELPTPEAIWEAMQALRQAQDTIKELTDDY